MSDFNPDDSETYQNLEQIYDVLTQIENKTETILDDFKSKKNQRPFEQGNPLEALKDFRGDPRRPTLSNSSMSGEIYIIDISPGETSAEIRSKVSKLTGVRNTQDTEIFYEIFDSRDERVELVTTGFDSSEVPIDDIVQIDRISSGTEYTAEVSVRLDRDVIAISKQKFTTEESTR